MGDGRMETPETPAEAAMVHVARLFGAVYGEAREVKWQRTDHGWESSCSCAGGVINAHVRPDGEFEVMVGKVNRPRMLTLSSGSFANYQPQEVAPAAEDQELFLKTIEELVNSKIETYASDFRFRLLKANQRAPELNLRDAIGQAIDTFGVRGDNVFTTGGVQSALNRGVEFGRITSRQIEQLLEGVGWVVRLRGGDHWAIIPGGHHRYEPEQEAVGVGDIHVRMHVSVEAAPRPEDT